MAALSVNPFDDLKIRCVVLDEELEALNTPLGIAISRELACSGSRMCETKRILTGIL